MKTSNHVRIRISDSHNQKEPEQKTDLLIINQHGGSPDFRFPKSMQSAFDSLGQPFLDFLRLEQDIGAEEIARSIAAICTDKGLRVVQIDCLAPRAIIDINRRPHFASSVHLQDDMLTDATKIHRETTAAILALQETLSPSAILDMHTMAPSAPEESPTLSLDNRSGFIRHVDIWSAAARGGALRPTCLYQLTC